MVSAQSAGYLRFRKSWHPVGLNVGECMSYAAAEAIPM
jgi:uncharacterized protein with PIN domain